MLSVNFQLCESRYRLFLVSTVVSNVPGSRGPVIVSVKTGRLVKTATRTETVIPVVTMNTTVIENGAMIKITVSITPRPITIVASSAVIVVVVAIGHQTRNCRKHSNRSDEITELVPVTPHLAAIPGCAVIDRFRIGQRTEGEDHQQDRSEHIYRISFFMTDLSSLLDFVRSFSHIKG